MPQNGPFHVKLLFARVRAEYPNQLDYSGFCWAQEGATLPQDACVLSQQGHAGTAVVFKHSPFDPKVAHQDGRARGQATLDVCGQRHYLLLFLIYIYPSGAFHV